VPLTSIASLGGIGWGINLDFLSGNSVDGLLGKGFNFPQNQYFEPAASSQVVLRLGNNTSEYFVEDSTQGTTIYYKLASGNNSQASLVRTGVGTSADKFTLTLQKYGLWEIMRSCGLRPLGGRECVAGWVRTH